MRVKEELNKKLNGILSDLKFVKAINDYAISDLTYRNERTMERLELVTSNIDDYLSNAIEELKEIVC